jgi:hypothetical protein
MQIPSDVAPSRTNLSFKPYVGAHVREFVKLCEQLLTMQALGHEARCVSIVGISRDIVSESVESKRNLFKRDGLREEVHRPELNRANGCVDGSKSSKDNHIDWWIHSSGGCENLHAPDAVHAKIRQNDIRWVLLNEVDRRFSVESCLNTVTLLREQSSHGLCAGNVVVNDKDLETTRFQALLPHVEVVVGRRSMRPRSSWFRS